MDKKAFNFFNKKTNEWSAAQMSVLPPIELSIGCKWVELRTDKAGIKREMIGEYVGNNIIQWHENIIVY